MGRYYDVLKRGNDAPAEQVQPVAAGDAAEDLHPFSPPTDTSPHGPQLPTEDRRIGAVVSASSESKPQAEPVSDRPHPPALQVTARLIPNGVAQHAVEQYRRLRTTLAQHRESAPFRTVVVTSTNPSEGKTVTTLNLGITFAMLPSFRVLVVDGDLRRGTVGTWLGMQDSPGFANLLEGSAKMRDVIQHHPALSLSVVTHGSASLPPTELLNTRALQFHLNALADSFDLVLIDSPPAGLVADSHLLAKASDAVLVVVRAFSTTQRQVRKTMRDFEGFRVLGAVFNCGSAGTPYNRYASYY